MTHLRPDRRPARRASRFLGIAIVVALTAPFAVPTPAYAASKLEVARQRYRELQSKLNVLTSEHSKQVTKLDVIDGKLNATSAKITESEKQTRGLQDKLRSRVRTAYRMGGAGQLQFLFQAASFRELSLRIVVLERQSTQDEDLMLELRRNRSNLRQRKSELKSQRSLKRAEVAALGDRSKELNSTLSEMGTLVKQFDAEERARLSRLASAGARTRSFGGGGGGGGGGSGRVVNLKACPTAGPHSFSNDWGAPRGGGTRRHRGNDIFAAIGSPGAAVVSGRISRLSSGGNGGLAVYLFGDDGNEYYYAHMSKFISGAGDRVSAGQTVALVGDSGNARGGSPHIHFEVHPGGSGAINPYPSLVRVC